MEQKTRTPAGSTNPMPTVNAEFTPIIPRQNLLGFASVQLGGDVTINNIRVLNGSHGVFAAMPSVQNKDGEYVELCHPTTQEMRSAINAAVRELYESVVSKANGSAQRGIEQSGKDESAAVVPISIKVYPRAPEAGSKNVGFAEMNVGNHFVIKSIRLVSGSRGIFASVPSVKSGQDKDGKAQYSDIVTLSQNARSSLNKAAREGYKAAFENEGAQTISVSERMNKRAEEIRNTASGDEPPQQTITPVARIDYYQGKEVVGSRSFTNAADFLSQVDKDNTFNTHQKMKITLYRNSEGNTIPRDFVKTLDEKKWGAIAVQSAPVTEHPVGGKTNER